MPLRSLLSWRTRNGEPRRHATAFRHVTMMARTMASCACGWKGTCQVADPQDCEAEPDGDVFQWASRAATSLIGSNHPTTLNRLVREADAAFPATKAVAYALAFMRCSGANKATHGK